MVGSVGLSGTLTGCELSWATGCPCGWLDSGSGRGCWMNELVLKGFAEVCCWLNGLAGGEGLVGKGWGMTTVGSSLGGFGFDGAGFLKKTPLGTGSRGLGLADGKGTNAFVGNGWGGCTGLVGGGRCIKGLEGVGATCWIPDGRVGKTKNSSKCLKSLKDQIEKISPISFLYALYWIEITSEWPGWLLRICVGCGRSHRCTGCCPSVELVWASCAYWSWLLTNTILREIRPPVSEENAIR